MIYILSSSETETDGDGRRGWQVTSTNTTFDPLLKIISHLLMLSPFQRIAELFCIVSTMNLSRGLLAAALVASSIPLTHANDTEDTSDASLASTTGVKLSPTELLRMMSAEAVMASEFPSVELHSAWTSWKTTFKRAYESTEEAALRKLTWLENHGVL
jgi:hypothetical protein